MKPTTLFCCFFLLFILSDASRLPISPYPASSLAVQQLYVIDSDSLPPNLILTIETLQGILARATQSSNIYVVSSSSFEVAQRSEKSTGFLAYTRTKDYAKHRKDAYQLWLADLQQSFNIKINTSFQTNALGLISFFKPFIQGYTLCDENSLDSINAAISLSAVTESNLAVTVDNEKYVQKLNIPLTADVRHLTSQDIFNKYAGKFNNKIVNYQSPTSARCMADYAVFCRALRFFAPSDSDFTKQVLASLVPGKSAILGWGPDEFNTVSALSNYAVPLVANDWASNMAVFTNVNGPSQFHQKTSSHSAYKRTINSKRRKRNTKQHTVCFLMTDGDNVQWILNTFATDPKWFASPSRGMVNLGWTISPSLSELAPSVLQWLYNHAAFNSSSNTADNFVSAVSGYGYLYPDLIANDDELKASANTSAQFMKKADLKVVNVLANNYNPQHMDAYLEQDQIKGVFYYLYSDYSGLNGKLDWSANSKPIIGGRFNLWSPQFENVTSLVEKLKEQKKDITSPDGYSLIPVHVWSHTVDDVVQVVKLLQQDDADGFNFVTPDQFVDLITTNIPH